MRATVSTTRTSGRERLLRLAVTLTVFLVLVLFLSTARYPWSWESVWGRGGYRAMFFQGLGLTAVVSVFGMAVGLVLGFAGGVARLSRRVVPNQLGAVYVELIRGTPLLVQVILGMYVFWPVLNQALVRLGAPPDLGDPVLASGVVGTVTLGVFSGAYVTEIVRAAVESVDRGQTEAALAQGMTRTQVLRHVLLPQALRRMVPPLAGQFVSLVKDSSLLSTIAVLEVTKRAMEVQSATYRPFEAYLPLALLYLVITFPLSRLARRLELGLT
jgi:polar amino acid transport system permease protein